MQQFTLGSIRLLSVHVQHEHSTLDVIAGSASVAHGTISPGEAHDLVQQGHAVWVGEAPPAEPLNCR
jgi:hypothetical protein